MIEPLYKAVGDGTDDGEGDASDFKFYLETRLIDEPFGRRFYVAHEHNHHRGVGGPGDPIHMRDITREHGDGIGNGSGCSDGTGADNSHNESIHFSR